MANQIKWKDKTYPCQSLKTQMMSLNPFYTMTPRETPIPIHNKRHVLRDWTLRERSDQQLPYT